MTYEGWSDRAKIVYKRTYARVKDDGYLEEWPDTIERVIGHQRWLWQNAGGKVNEDELAYLRTLMLERKALVAGRTLWLGGTEIAKKRASSQFNCSFGYAESVNDVVDIFWLLLQGCGTGFLGHAGSLYGFLRPIEDVEVIPSTRESRGGDERNWEYFDNDTKVWTIRIGDDAGAWAKSLGKLIAHPYPARKLVLDFSQVRPAGGQLKGYGWTCNGWTPLRDAYLKIVKILNDKAGQQLSDLDIQEILNYLGTVLSSRRSAQIALMRSDNPLVEQFAKFKMNCWEPHLAHRQQSNNTIMYYNRPSKEQLQYHFDLMVEAGGSEPGIANAAEALRRAPYFKGFNPCGEVLLSNKGFCNLVTVDLAKLDFNEAKKAVYEITRANYRQTCVDLRDGVLQDQWHHNNNFLRLCGVSLTGQAMCDWLTPFLLEKLHMTAYMGARDMADELHLPRPANVTTVKPEGTLGKLMDTTEGIHVPLGSYIFNQINVSVYSPLLGRLLNAGYDVEPHPTDPQAALVKFPSNFEGAAKYMTDIGGGREVNLMSAVEQLNRYKIVMENYVDHNASITVSYDDNEIPAIVDWFHENWDSYVGVSFIKRIDLSIDEDAAKQLGYAYLPQEIVSRDKYQAYVDRLKPVDIENVRFEDDDPEQLSCEGGACPIR